MTPIEISNQVATTSDEKLRNKLNFLSYTFCVNADFSKVNAVEKLVDELEMFMMEGLLRVLEDEIGYRPYQNKIYEQVEKVFENQDAYNINRMMSSIRRAKMIPIDVENEKYMKWMKNRIKYGVKAIMERLAFYDEDEVNLKAYH